MKRATAFLALMLASFLLVSCSESKATQNEVTIDMRLSRFTPGEFTVASGEPVTFTLKNGDPIAHEWIVGTDEVHERHRTGTEPFHDSRPTEVTIPAYSTRVTTVTFDTPGSYVFICHLPGHEAYGMRGTIHVVEKPPSEV